MVTFQYHILVLTVCNVCTDTVNSTHSCSEWKVLNTRRTSTCHLIVLAWTIWWNSFLRRTCYLYMDWHQWLTSWDIENLVLTVAVANDNIHLLSLPQVRRAHGCVPCSGRPWYNAPPPSCWRRRMMMMMTIAPVINLTNANWTFAKFQRNIDILFRVFWSWSEKDLSFHFPLTYVLYHWPSFTVILLVLNILHCS